LEINKDTSLYGSFSKEAGNTGCRIFNKAFQYYDLNCIYKSFSIENIKDALDAAKILNIKGFAISMPFKIEVINYVDELNFHVKKIGACNTIINNNGKLIAYNTDYLAAKQYLSTYIQEYKQLYILGNGGYAQAVKYAATSLDINYNIITRNNWNMIPTLKDCIIYNCTPTNNKIDQSNLYIDCLTITNTGKDLALIQASKQFELYTKRKFPTII